MVLVVPVITDITFVFAFLMRCVSIVIFSVSFFITFLALEIATSINIPAPFSISRIMMSSLLLEMILSAHKISAAVEIHSSVFWVITRRHLDLEDGTDR